MTTSACSPSPTSRRKIPARPFHNTGMLARQTGITFLSGDTPRRVLRWLALRGSPPGNRERPDMPIYDLIYLVVNRPRRRPAYAIKKMMPQMITQAELREEI